MTALVATARAICLDCALSIDMAAATGEEAWTARAAFLTPIAKAFGTDVGCEVSELALQVFGGMGYVEETGVAQFYRDVRVTAIYEGTNGIQAMDMVGRKLADGGRAAQALIEAAEETARQAAGDLGARLAAAARRLAEATGWMAAAEPNDRFAGAVPYLRAFALTLGGHYLLRAALAEGEAGRGPRWRGSTSAGCCRRCRRSAMRPARARRRSMRLTSQVGMSDPGSWVHLGYRCSEDKCSCAARRCVSPTSMGQSLERGSILMTSRALLCCRQLFLI